ncbi:hypothetical protein JCM12296A_43860 [Desulfosarcina cetonica]
MKKRKYLGLWMLIVLLSGCTQVNRAKTYLISPSTLGMEKIAPHVFVNPDMSPADREKVAGIAMAAKEKIINFYGGVISAPDILACSTQASFKRLGGTSQRGLLLGTSKILISQKGLTTPILTHEWSHAELRARMDAKMGGVFGISSMPTWFDEGLAVVVSEEPSHSEKMMKAKSILGNLQQIPPPGRLKCWF